MPPNLPTPNPQGQKPYAASGTKKTPQPPLKQIDASTDLASIARSQGYDTIDHGNGSPVPVGAMKNGQYVTFTNGHTPESMEAQKQQQTQQSEAFKKQGVLNAQTDANGTLVSGISAVDGQMLRLVNGKIEGDGKPNADRLKQAQALATQPAAAATNLTPEQQDWKTQFGHLPGTASHPYTGAPSAPPSIPAAPLPPDVALQTSMAHQTASPPPAQFTPPTLPANPVPITGPTATPTYGNGLGAAAANAAYQQQHPGETTAATPGTNMTFFGPNGPQAIPQGGAVTALPGNRAIVNNGTSTTVQSGAPAGVAEQSRTVGADGTTHIVTASGGRVDIPPSIPPAPGGGTGTSTGIVGNNNQEIVRTPQGNLAPGTSPSPATPAAVAASSQSSAALQNADFNKESTTGPLAQAAQSKVAATSAQPAPEMDSKDFDPPKAPVAPLQPAVDAVTGFFANLKPASGDENGNSTDYTPPAPTIPAAPPASTSTAATTPKPNPSGTTTFTPPAAPVPDPDKAVKTASDATQAAFGGGPPGIPAPPAAPPALDDDQKKRQAATSKAAAAAMSV